MAETFTDVIRLPSQTQVAEVKPGDILASYSPPPLIKGGTIKAGASFVAGTPMALETATKKYVAYANAGAGGLGVCVGILLEKVDATGTADKLGNIIMRGTVKAAPVMAAANYHAGVLTDLNGRIIDRSTAASNDGDYIAF